MKKSRIIVIGVAALIFMLVPLHAFAMDGGELLQSAERMSIETPVLKSASGVHKIQEDGSLFSGWTTEDGHERYYDPTTLSMVRDRTVDKLYINANGEVTEAARLASKVLDEIGWTLEDAYAYCRDTEYERAYGDLSVQGTTALAEYVFTNKKGNCYRKSAAFWYLAKTIGYDGLKNVAGTVLEDHQRHGWCEVEEDGVLYIFDPTNDDVNHDWNESTGWSSFHVPHGAPHTFSINPGYQEVPL